MKRVTLGAFPGAEPPDFTRDELHRVSKCLGKSITAGVLNELREIRGIYWAAMSLPEQMPTLDEAEALRLKWLRRTQKINELASSTARDGKNFYGKNFRADQALRQLLAKTPSPPPPSPCVEALKEVREILRGALQQGSFDLVHITAIHRINAALDEQDESPSEYGAAVDELVRAASRLQRIVERQLDDDASIRDIRTPKVMGLRHVIYFLREPVEGGSRRGERLGLKMGSGSGRGATGLHEFLSVITKSRIGPNEIKNATG